MERCLFRQFVWKGSAKVSSLENEEEQECSVVDRIGVKNCGNMVAVGVVCD